MIAKELKLEQVSTVVFDWCCFNWHFHDRSSSGRTLQIAIRSIGVFDEVIRRLD